MNGWGSQQCQVIAVDPGRPLTYTLAEGTLDTTVTSRLETEGAGTAYTWNYPASTSTRRSAGRHSRA
jgi:hypothetical protein